MRKYLRNLREIDITRFMSVDNVDAKMSKTSTIRESMDFTVYEMKAASHRLRLM